MWRTTRTLALATLVTAATSLPALAAGGPSGAPVAADAAHARPAAEAPLTGAVHALWSWLVEVWAGPGETEARTVTGASGHHMDPDGSAESTESDSRRRSEADLRIRTFDPAPEVL